MMAQWHWEILVSWIIKGRSQCVPAASACLACFIARNSPKPVFPWKIQFLVVCYWVTWAFFKNADFSAPPPGDLINWWLGTCIKKNPLLLLFPKRSPSAWDRQPSLWTMVLCVYVYTHTYMLYLLYIKSYGNWKIGVCVSFPFFSF